MEYGKIKYVANPIDSYAKTKSTKRKTSWRIVIWKSYQHQLKKIDPLTELLKNGAHGLIRQAVETELENMLSEYSDLKLLNGR